MREEEEEGKLCGSTEHPRGRLRIAVGRAWVEAPLEHMRGKDLAPGKLAVRGALRLRANVDQDRAGIEGGARLGGGRRGEPCPQICPEKCTANGWEKATAGAAPALRPG